MGCAATKDYSTQANGKCNCKCHQNGAPTNAPTDGGVEKFTDDPRLPLSGRQKFSLTKSWKAISRNISQAGMVMFVSLFEKHEVVRLFFVKTLNADVKSLSDLAENKKLQSHVASVMLTIDEAMTTLNDADHLIDMLTHIGETHVRFAGFLPEWFLLIEEPFLVAVKDTLGERYTLSMEDNYRKAIRFILDTLFAGFAKGKKISNE
ncbi:hypothetical protein SNE40_010045 [Patella caerulea]|uniref:Globin n=1 Tax=Patella caerulea TaxID=87958 RepID=A0AAN8JTN7_PATCE